LSGLRRGEIVSDNDAWLFEFAKIQTIGVTGQLAEDAGDDVAHITGAFAEVLIIYFSEGGGVTFADELKGLLGVDLIFANRFDGFLDEHGIFEDHEVSIEDAALLGADAIGDLALDFLDLLTGSQQRLLETGNFRREFYVRQMAVGNFMVVFIENKNLATANPVGNRDAAENFFAFVQPLGHASGLTKEVTLKRNCLHPSKKQGVLALAARFTQGKNQQKVCYVA
jgi:hypothetical protein